MYTKLIFPNYYFVSNHFKNNLFLFVCSFACCCHLNGLRFGVAQWKKVKWTANSHFVFMFTVVSHMFVIVRHMNNGILRYSSCSKCIKHTIPKLNIDQVQQMLYQCDALLQQRRFCFSSKPRGHTSRTDASRNLLCLHQSQKLIQFIKQFIPRVQTKDFSS